MWTIVFVAIGVVLGLWVYNEFASNISKENVRWFLKKLFKWILILIGIILIIGVLWWLIDYFVNLDHNLIDISWLLSIPAGCLVFPITYLLVRINQRRDSKSDLHSDVEKRKQKDETEKKMVGCWMRVCIIAGGIIIIPFIVGIIRFLVDTYLL